MEQCSGFYLKGAFQSHLPCEMIYEGTTTGKLKLPLPLNNQKRFGHNVLREELKGFLCPICKNSCVVKTGFWIDLSGNEYDDNEEIIGRVDKWKPIY